MSQALSSHKCLRKEHTHSYIQRKLKTVQRARTMNKEGGAMAEQ